MWIIMWTDVNKKDFFIFQSIQLKEFPLTNSTNDDDII